MEPALRVGPALERFAATGRFRAVTRSRLEAIGAAGALLVPLHGGAPENVDADAVVLVCHPKQDADLAHALHGAPFDAQSPRFLEAAIRDGHLAGRAV